MSGATFEKFSQQWIAYKIVTGHVHTNKDASFARGGFWVNICGTLIDQEH